MQEADHFTHLSLKETSKKQNKKPTKPIKQIKYQKELECLF